MPTEAMKQKIFENRMRRVAWRQGYTLSRSRRRDPRAIDYEKFALIDATTNVVVFGADHGRYYASIEDIQAWLEG